MTDVCRSAEAFHHGLVGRKDDVVLVLAEIAGAFQFERPDDFEGDAFVAYGLADGIPFGEQVLDDALAYNADFCHAVGFIVEHDAVFDFVVADDEVVGGDAAQLRGGVVVSDDGLARDGNHGGDGVDICRLFAEFQDVFFFEGFGGFHLHASAPVAVRHDDDGVRAHGGHLVLDTFFGAFAHGDHGDDGGNAYHDAEHREEGAHAVPEQCLQSDFYEGGYAHGEGASGWWLVVGEKFGGCVAIIKPVYCLLLTIYYLGVECFWRRERLEGCPCVLDAFVHGVLFQEPVAERDGATAEGRDVRFVRHERDGLPLRIQFLEEHHDFVARARIKVTRRFVGEDDHGVVHEGAGDGDALLLAAAHLVWHVVHAVGESHALEGRHGAVTAFGAGNFGIVQKRQFHVLDGGGSAQKVVTLEHESDFFAADAGERIALELFGVLSVQNVVACRRTVHAAEDV